MTAIKICGLGRECDIDFVNEAKPDCIGFILNVPKSRRNVYVERAAELRSRLLPGIRAVGVFVDQPVETVREAAERIPLDVIQLHGREDDRYIAELKNRTDRPVWKAFQIKGPDDLEAAQRCTADEILLDINRAISAVSCALVFPEARTSISSAEKKSQYWIGKRQIVWITA